MRTTVELNGIEWSIKELKAAFRWGCAVHAERRSGKTTALLQWAEDFIAKSGQRLGFISMNWNMAQHAERVWRDRWELADQRRPVENAIIFTTANSLDRLAGITRLAVVDEWWHIPDKGQHDILSNFHLLAAVGTMQSYVAMPLLTESHRKTAQQGGE